MHFWLKLPSASATENALCLRALVQTLGQQNKVLLLSAIGDQPSGNVAGATCVPPTKWNEQQILALVPPHSDAFAEREADCDFSAFVVELTTRERSLLGDSMGNAIDQSLSAADGLRRRREYFAESLTKIPNKRCYNPLTVSSGCVEALYQRAVSAARNVMLPTQQETQESGAFVQLSFAASGKSKENICGDSRRLTLSRLRCHKKAVTRTPSESSSSFCDSDFEDG